MIRQERSTFPKLLFDNAQRWRDEKVAIRQKDFGRWRLVTWKAYFEQVKSFALGLKQLGFKRGEHAAIIGDNEPEWVYAELAVQSLGGVAVGVYGDSTPAEIQYVVKKSDAVFVVTEDQEQVDKLLEIKDALPKVRSVIYWDAKGLRLYDDEWLQHFSQVQKQGRAFAEKNPQFFETEIEKGANEDTALILATSGTTSEPKLAMLSYRNMLKMAENLFARIDPADEDDEFVSMLPLPWVGEQMTAISSSLYFGFTLNFPEEQTTAPNDIREIAPNFMFSPPRVWEGLLSSIQVKMEDASWVKRRIYKTFMPFGHAVASLRCAGQTLGLPQKIKYAVGWMLLFRSLKDRLGLSRIRMAYTGGAALGADTFRFFHAIGVNLKQIYGQTEIAGVSVVHRNRDVKFDTVGQPIDETEIRIAEDGEILSRSPCVFQGYYKDSAATQEALQDGWLHSGDAGYLDEDGHLIVIDRKKDVVKLTSGQVFSPQFIENKLKFSLNIKEAVVFGQSRDAITAFVNIDFDNTAKWAESRRISFTSFNDLSQKEEIRALIRAEVDAVNSHLPESARIKHFVNLHKELDADDQELTRTRKVRRGFVERKYQQIVDAMYDDKVEITIEALVKYRDGRERTMSTNLKIETMF